MLIALTLGACGSSSDSAKSSSDEATTSTAVTASGDTKKISGASLEKLLRDEKNLKCTYTFDDKAGNVSTGTTYIADKKMYVKYTASVEGKQTTGYMLNDGTYSYMWTDGEAKGTKIKNDPDDATSTSTTSDSKTSEPKSTTTFAPGAVDDEQAYDYDCAKWNVDQSLLSAPKGIDFLDLNALTNSAGIDPEAIKKQACEVLTDPDEKRFCESALQ